MSSISSRALSFSCTQSMGSSSLPSFSRTISSLKASLKSFHYFQIRPRHGAVWLLIDGIVTLILALMIWRSWPQSSIWVVGTLVGISMILSGVSRLMLSLAAKRVINRIV